MRRVEREPGRVLFDGWYGYRNTGDDAFCHVSSHVAAAEWRIEEPWFAGRGGCLPLTPVRIRDIIPHPARFPGHVRAAVAVAAARARRVVHAGGSTLKRAQTSLRDQVALHRLGLVDIHLAGVSVGPFASLQEAKNLAPLLRHVASISVRDEASRDRLLDMDPDLRVSVAFDIGVLLPAVAQAGRIGSAPTKSERKVIGISLCPAGSRFRDPDVERMRLNRVIDLIRQVVRRTDATVRLLEFCGHPAYGDRPALSYAAEALRGQTVIEYVEYSPDPTVMMGAVSTSDFVIAMRLHAAIFAFAVGVPSLTVPYEQKGRDVGLMFSREDFIAPITGPDPAHSSLVEGALHSDALTTYCISADVARERARTALPDLRLA